MALEEQEVGQQALTWRIVAVLNFPVQLASASPPVSGEVLPQKLTTVSRIPDRASLEENGITIKLQSWPGPPFPTLPFGPSGVPDEPAALVFVTPCDTAAHALEKVEPLLESLLDGLSFQLQTAIRVLQLEVLDVTPPLAEGMKRSLLFYPFPNGYPSAKFLQSVPLGNILTPLQPALSACFRATSTSIRAALRWYVKGLASPYEVDKFIFFWIALEILLSESNISVEEPYRARCGHEIATCPTCGQKTSRVVYGRSIKAFLAERLGIRENDVNHLWELRQMLHGANDLTPQATSELPRMVLILRQAVVNAIKDALGCVRDDLPLVLEQGPSIDPHFRFEGTRAIDKYDLEL